MNVGIIGSGGVGQSLARGFKSEGYNVMIGTRDTAKPALVKFNSETGIAIGTFEETAKFGGIIVLCTKGSAAEEALNLAGIENFDGKVVIDTTNPIATLPPTDGVLHFTTNLESSLMEQLQQAAPKAKFVKAFNSVGNTLMYKPKLKGGTPSMFICGDDEAARQTVTDILTAFGWETEDHGKAIAARAIEPLCMLWCIHGFLKNDWEHAYKVLRP